MGGLVHPNVYLDIICICLNGNVRGDHDKIAIRAIVYGLVVNTGSSIGSNSLVFPVQSELVLGICTNLQIIWIKACG